MLSKIKTYQAVKQGQKKLVFAPPSLILTNYFLPVTGRYVYSQIWGVSFLYEKDVINESTG